MTTWEKIWANLGLAIRMASTYIASAAFLGAGWWLNLSDVARKAFEVEHPWAAKYGLAISAAAYIVAKLWPQRSVTETMLRNAIAIKKAERPDAVVGQP